jgi:hypothetical protein
MRDAGLLDQLVGRSVDEDPEYRQFIVQSGFDYKTDLDQVLGKLTENSSYFVLTGRFDWRHLIDFANKSGGRCHNGECQVQGSRPDRLISFYPIRKQVMALAVGSTGYEAMRIKLARARDTDAALPADPIWIRASGSILRNTGKLPEGTRQFAKLLGETDSVMLRLGPDQERFLAAVEVNCKSAEAAAVLKTKLEDLTGMLRKMIAQEKQVANPNDLSGILTAGTFAREGKQVQARWPVLRSFLQTLGGS